jgi:hypothetical protein
MTLGGDETRQPVVGRFALCEAANLGRRPAFQPAWTR